VYEAMYARTSDGAIYFSADGGKTWSNRAVGGAQTTALTRDGAGLLYAGTNKGVYRSSSGGLSWILTDQQDQSLSPLVLQRLASWSSRTRPAEPRRQRRVSADPYARIDCAP